MKTQKQISFILGRGALKELQKALNGDSFDEEKWDREIEELKQELLFNANKPEPPVKMYVGLGMYETMKKYFPKNLEL